jgi:hypothetical protein
MGISNRMPSIVPKSDDQDVYLVVDDLGSYGEVWREVETVATDVETVITAMLSSQYNRPVRVVAFNTFEGWSCDVSEDFAHEVRRRSDLQRKDLPEGLEDFIRRFEAGDREQFTLRLV